MVFIETPLFTRQLHKLLDDDSYAEFQATLIRNPQAGDVVVGTGGLAQSAHSAAWAR